MICVDLEVERLDSIVGFESGLNQTLRLICCVSLTLLGGEPREVFEFGHILSQRIVVGI